MADEKYFADVNHNCLKMGESITNGGELGQFVEMIVSYSFSSTVVICDNITDSWPYLKAYKEGKSLQSIYLPHHCQYNVVKIVGNLWDTLSRL